MSTSTFENEEETDILKSSGNDFFKLLEAHLKTTIPTIIKNILIFSEYNCAIVLATIDDVAITSIEDNLKNNLDADMLLAGESMETFLGRYSRCQQKFKFMPGHLKWFSLIAQKCRALLGEDPPAPPSESTPSPPSNTPSVSTETLDDSYRNYNETIKHNAAKFFKLIAAQIITVFNDAKRITLSAWSWPSREVASQLASDFKVNGSDGDTSIKDKLDLLYVTPSHHTDLLDCIVKSDFERFEDCLLRSLAISLRVDGSVDRMQKHNVYALLTVISEFGIMKTYFLGFDVPDGNSALAYQHVIQKIAEKILPWDQLLSMTTSLVTDGESKNTGSLIGLWQRLKQEKADLNNGPFITIWCIGHRVNLGWKDTCKFTIIDDLIKCATNVSSYFHFSGERTRLLAAIATQENLNQPLHYPTYFEIRWIEFTHNLLHVILRNWNAMITYFKSINAVGYENLWLSHDRIHFTTFLCDVMTVLKTFQKTFQSNSISILQLPSKSNTLIADLLKLKTTPLENGWEELLLKELVKADNGTITLRGHKLETNSRLRSGGYKFSNIQRKEVIDTLIRHLNERLNYDKHIQTGLAPLLQLDPQVTHDSLKVCHAIIIPEMDSEQFCCEYYEASNLLGVDDRKNPLTNVIKLEESASKQFTVLKFALARGAVIKPHSADVENMINIYNKYKDSDRSVMSKETLFNNMYVHTNMCTLSEFDPTMATEFWLNQKERTPRRGAKVTQQEWFKGVFPEAHDSNRPNLPIIQF